MSVYALATIPLIHRLPNNVIMQMMQVLVEQFHINFVFAVGPAFITFSYLPNAIKTLLVVKEQHLKHTQLLFANTCVNVTTDGRPHLGATILSTAYPTQFVSTKITAWVQNYNYYHQLMSPSSMRLTLPLHMESSTHCSYYTFPTT